MKWSHPNYDSSQSWDPLGEILYPDPPREASLQESSDSGNCNGEYPIVVLHPELALENTSAPQVMFCDIILTPAFRTLLSIDNSPFRNAFLTQPPATSVMVAGKMIEDEAGITFAHVVGAYKRQLVWSVRSRTEEPINTNVYHHQAQFQPRRPKTAYHRRLLSKKRLPSTVAQASRFWEDMGILAGVEKWELIIWDVVPDISGHVEAAGDGSQNSMYKGVTMPLIECEERTYKVRGSAVEVKWCVCGKGWE